MCDNLNVETSIIESEIKLTMFTSFATLLQFARVTLAEWQYLNTKFEQIG